MPHISSRSGVSLNSVIQKYSKETLRRIFFLFPAPHWEKQNMKAKLHLLLKAIVHNSADSIGNIATNKTICSAQMHFI